MSATSGRKRRRQDIVSCAFCRSKKLKCDREDPCSNCKSRNIQCTSVTVEDEGPRQEGTRTSNPAYPTYPSNRGRNSDQTGFIPNLAYDLYSPKGGPSTSWQSLPHSSPSRRSQTPEDDPISRTAVDLETTTVEVGESNYGSGMDQPSTLPQPKLSLLVPLGERQVQPPITVDEVKRCLPSLAQSLRLFHHYVDTLNWTCPIIHVPTQRTHLRSLYEEQSELSASDLGQLALTATILGCSAYFWVPSLGLDNHTAATLAYRLTDLAQRAVVNAGYMENPTVPTIQVLILLATFLLRDSRGPATASPIVGLVWFWMRKMSIHLLDSPVAVKQRMLGSVDHVEVEVKRRLCNFIASTDWLISTTHGPCFGTYLIHPKQMHIDLPSNVDDDALDKDGAYARPLTTFTDTRYALLRRRLAEYCRETTDAACTAGVNPEQLSYETVMQLDKRLELISADIPVFFRMDEESRLQSKATEREKPYMVWQRSMVHLGLNSKRSQLHRPFLGRGFRDARYSYSRKVCIDCALVVLQVDGDFRESAKGMSPKISEMWMVVHHLFLAGLVLALDLRFNATDHDREREVVQCCERLELRQNESVLARKGAQQLRKILRELSMGTLAKESGKKQQPDSNSMSQGTDPTANDLGQSVMMPTFNGMDSLDFMTDFDFTNQLSDFGLEQFGFPTKLGSSWDDVFPLSLMS